MDRCSTSTEALKVTGRFNDARAALSALEERLGEARYFHQCEHTDRIAAEARAVDAEARLEEAQRHIVALQHGRRMDHHAAITDLQTALGAAPSEYRSFAVILPRITELVATEAREKALIEALRPFTNWRDWPWDKFIAWLDQGDVDAARAALVGVRGQGKEGQEAGDGHSASSGGNTLGEGRDERWLEP